MEQSPYQKTNHSRTAYIVLAVVLIVVILVSLFLFFKINGLEEENTTLRNEITDLSTKLENSRQKNTALDEKNEELLATLEEKDEKVRDLKERVGDVTGALDNVTDTIDHIQKLNSLDPKLLKKYSEVSFLNENYYPKHLEKIPKRYDYPDGERELFLENALPFLTDMVEEAKEDGVKLSVISAYRSFGEQRALKNHYTVVYGPQTANSFSAEQGYSEHQLGTTVDFTTTSVGASFSGFDNTEAFDWLVENAYKYGFILSYPKENTYYTYEPWHWRFVGEELADDLHDKDEYFYEISQDKIDEYLITIFDN